MPKTRQDMAGFKASARVLDDGIGRVLEALAAHGLAENTLVICTTDHGLPMPGMKCTLTDHGLGVMLIIRGPGGFSGGRICEAMVSQLDLFPTICDLLELTPPAWLQGQSIMPLVRNEVDEINEEIFAEINYHAAYEPQRAVRTKRWKYIRRFDGRDRPVASNIEDSLSKDIWLERGWRDRPVPSEQLFDLIFDPNEANNLVHNPAAAEVLQDMRRRLEHRMKATDDPLLRGPIGAPPGAEFNDPDGLSPYETTLVQLE
jgi:arylsulfatase A-like enzyme